MIPDDYLAADEQFKEKLKGIDGVREIRTAFDVEAGKGKGSFPRIDVVYFGDVVKGASEGGVRTDVQQRWLIVLLVSKSRRDRKLESRILYEINQRLNGEKIGECGIAKRFTTSRPMGIDEHSFAYPVGYEIPVKIKRKVS